MNLKYKLYCIIVNRNPEVKRRYESYTVSHAKQHNKFRLLSWAYLAWLNICSPFLKSGDCPRGKQILGCESAEVLSPEAFADKLCRADVVSFDVFDTLIFRPFSTPADLFYVIGQKLDHPDFRNIRITAERIARENDKKKGGNGEIGIEDIYRQIEDMTGIDHEKGIVTEKETELSLCFANPFMLKVWNEVKKRGKKMIAASDMYMPSEFISELLEKNGFYGADRIYVSCEQGCGKFKGQLFKKIKEAYPGKKLSHIGDHHESDYTSASSCGINAVHYLNADVTGNVYRTFDMSFITGSVYRGIVNKRLHCGMEAYSLQYEYGYKCGGILVLGFCQYIKKFFTEKKADKVLFFSRDGYIIKKVYEKLYPEDKTEYVCWSRNAAALLSFDIMPYDYFRRFIYQKTSMGITVGKALEAMGISAEAIGVDADEKLTYKNADDIRKAIWNSRELIKEQYSDMNTAAQMYFSRMLEGCSSAVTVDCGWAGTGNVILDKLIRDKWGIPCELTGLLCGSNGSRQPDSDYCETYFASGKLRSYCFSSDNNRDLYKNHIPAEKHNIYFEMLLSAPEPSFLRFELAEGETKLVFDSECENLNEVREIHKGIMDFADDYLNAFGNCDLMPDISGRDAYAPFAAAISNKGRYPAYVLKNCVFDALTAGRKEKI